MIHFEISIVNNNNNTMYVPCIQSYQVRQDSVYNIFAITKKGLIIFSRLIKNNAMYRIIYKIYVSISNDRVVHCLKSVSEIV